MNVHLVGIFDNKKPYSIYCVYVCVCPFVIGELRVVFKSQLCLDFLIIEMETFERFCGQCLHLVVIWVTCKSIHNMRL